MENKERLFTQADVNRIVKERLERQKRKYEREIEELKLHLLYLRRMLRDDD